MGTGPPVWKHSWLSSDRAVPRLIARPLRIFLNTEAAGGAVLLCATAIALLWVNSPWSESYRSLWETELTLSVGSLELREDLRHWINDALMAIFFFVVGLEIKRELVSGELNDVRKAMLPALAALGGMVVPATIYLALTWSEPGRAGWGIPMVTDIAFAVGVLAVLGNRVPAGLKIFLLSLAIVDDIGAILVIAFFYSGGVDLGWLALAFGTLALIVVFRRVRILWVPVYVLLGCVVWLATFESGLHATLAGVMLGLLTPAKPTDPGGFTDVSEQVAALSREPDAESLRTVSMQAQEVVSVAERLEHLLHPWTSYLIVPLFALANAGLILSAEAFRQAATSRVTLGVIAGLVVGKVVGISGMSWLAVRFGVARLPAGVDLRHVVGAGAVAGIGFTVSLFISTLAFTDNDLIVEAKLGILVASVIAGVMGAVVLWRGPSNEELDAGV